MITKRDIMSKVTIKLNEILGDLKFKLVDGMNDGKK